MNKRLYLIFFLLIPFFTNGQKKTFYTVNGNITDSVNSHYYEILKGEKLKTISTYFTKTKMLRSERRDLDSINSRERTFFDNGKIQSISEHSKQSSIVKHANYYQNGVRESRFDYENSDGNLFMHIKEYSDSLGNKVIDNGNGICGCNLYISSKDEKGLDKGSVKNGVKDGIWEHWSGDTLIYTEIYDNGKFIKGTSYELKNEIEYLKIIENASPPKGLPDFYRQMNSVMKYPREARKNNIQGKVFVQFLINKDGSITDIAVLKGIGGGCDEEAIKAVRTSPKWIPSKQRGIPVRQRMILPITFAL